MLDLPVTEGVLQSVPRNQRIILVFHITKNSSRFIEMVARHCRVDLVVPIPYSSDTDLIMSLQRLVPVVVPRLLQDIPELVRSSIIGSAVYSAIIEIGGYCCQLALDRSLPIEGILEDTNQGYWKYAELRDKLAFPVVSIAGTAIKNLENRAVATAIAHAVEQILKRGCDESLIGKNVLVLGYGGLGKNLARVLRSLSSAVSVFDTSCYKVVSAILDGFTVPPKHEALAKADVVLGVTGRTSISRADFCHLRHGVFMASGSSKRIEFEMDFLENSENPTGSSGPSRNISRTFASQLCTSAAGTTFSSTAPYGITWELKRMAARMQHATASVC